MDTLIYLASKSPRRREILSNLGWEPVVLADPKAPRGWFAGDEEEKPGETPEDYVLRTAVVKLMDGLCARNELPDVREDRPVLAADTVVSLDGRVLGKPRDRAEAEAFLRSMSGRTHEVRTAVAVGVSRAEWDSVVVTSTVEMRELSEVEIAAYAATAEPYDKAGGYGIQGAAGLFICRISGSYSAIMGLPVCESGELLARFGAKAPILGL